MVVIKKNYRRYNETKLVTFTTTFASNLKLSTSTYPAPPVKPEDLTKASQDYQTAADNYRAEKSDYNTGQTRTARKALIDLLNADVSYVEQTAPDEDSVRSLGLEPAATKVTKAPLPGKPEGEGAKESDEPLSVTVFCKPVKLENSSAQVSYYVYETNDAGTEERRLMYSGTKSRDLSFGGLETGKVYYFYIRAKTTAGFGPPSKPIRWVGR